MGFYPMAVTLQYDTAHKNIHITENNTPRSNKTQHTYNKGPITRNEYNIKI
jgi:hypothetical protein